MWTVISQFIYELFVTKGVYIEIVETALNLTASRKRAESSMGKENWAIVELQGDIRSHSGSIEGIQLIGDLHFGNDGTPVLIIGHHLLVGKEAKFPKPLAVLEKKHDNNGCTEYTVKAIITKKLLFRVRPKPIIV